MFKIDSPIINFLSRLVDIVVLNLLFLICSIPVVTMGASLTAMYYVTVKMVKNEESYIWRDFFKSFKQNFKQATIIWCLNLFAIVVLVVDVLVVYRGISGEHSSMLLIAVIFMGIILTAEMLYVYPVLSHFENSVKNTIRNAFILALGNLPYTVLFLIIGVFPLLAFISPVGGYVAPLILLMGVSGPAYLCSLGWKRIFAKLESKEKFSGENEQEED